VKRPTVKYLELRAYSWRACDDEEVVIAASPSQRELFGVGTVEVRPKRFRGAQPLKLRESLRDRDDLLDSDGLHFCKKGLLALGIEPRARTLWWKKVKP
jgi:hypothetical protein